MSRPFLNSAPGLAQSKAWRPFQRFIESSTAPWPERIGRSIALIIVIVLGCPNCAPAESVALRPVADTTLNEFAPDNNMGGHTHVAAGAMLAPTRTRGLFRFDVAGALPSNAVVSSVALTLTVAGVPNGGGARSTFNLRRVLRSWAEGNKTGNRGEPASANETTWNARFFPDVLWSAPGGAAPSDFSDAVSAAHEAGGIGSYVFGPTAAMIADVQEWLKNPSSNFGWILMSESESMLQTARRFGSREDAANAPTLLVEYAVGSDAMPFRFESAIRLSDGGFQLTVSGEAGSSYVLEASANLVIWTAISTNTPATNRFDFVDREATNFVQRFYRVLQRP